MSAKEALYLGGTYLQSGDLVKGLRLFQNRHRIIGTDYDAPNALFKNTPAWNGELLSPGQHLTIIFEQGYGDCIMWIRTLFSFTDLHVSIYLPTSFFKRLIPALDTALKRIARANYSLDITDTVPRQVDRWVYLADIGTCLNYCKSDYRCHVSYLSPNSDKLDIWKKKIQQYKKPIVAFNLMGMDDHNDPRKMSMKDFIPILDLSTRGFIDLNRNRLVKHDNIVCADEIDREWAFSDTAAIMLSVDFVCTTDTSIVHLAGALGVQCYLFLVHNAEWRWFGESDTSFWYPTVIKCRQNAPGDWTEPIKTVLNHMQS